MRFSPSPVCRGDAANPWLESAFISHVGCVSHHRFVCFPQSLVIALYFGVFASGAPRARSFLHASVFTKHRIHSFYAHPSQRSTAAAALPAAGAARPHGKLCVLSFKTYLLDLFLSLCADGARQVRLVCAKPQRSGPGPGRRAHEAAQRQTLFLDHVLCLRNTIMSRRYLPQCLRRARAA